MHFNPFTARERPATAALCAIAVALLLMRRLWRRRQRRQRRRDRDSRAVTQRHTQGAPKCGLGNGQKATRHADQARRDRDQAAGHRLHRHPEHRRRRTSTASTTTAASTATRSSTSSRPSRPTPARSPRWPRSSSRPTRSSAIVGSIDASSSARSTTSTTSQQGLLRDRRRHRAECYATPNIAAVNMGPRYSSDGAAQYADPRRASRRSCFDAVQRAGHGLHRGRASS